MKKGMYVGIAAAVLVCVIAALVVFFGKGREKPQQIAGGAATQAAASRSIVPAAAPAAGARTVSVRGAAAARKLEAAAEDGIAFAPALLDAVSKKDRAVVERLFGKMPKNSQGLAARSAAAEYLIGEYGRAGDAQKIVELCREMFLDGDSSVPRAGYAACVKMQKDKAGRLGIAKAFDAFGYNLFAENDCVSFVADAMELKDDEAAQSFLEQLRLRNADRKKTAGLYLDYISSLAARKRPLDALVKASMPAVFMNDPDTVAKLLAVWKKIGDDAVAEKRAADLDGIAFFVSDLGDPGRAYAMALLGKQFDGKPAVSPGKKLLVFERVSAYGPSGRALIEREGPALMKEAMAANDIGCVEVLVRLFLGLNTAALEAPAVEGAAMLADLYIKEKLYQPAVSVAHTLCAVPNEGVRKKGVGIYTALLEDMGADAAFDQIFPVVQGALAARDPGLAGAARKTLSGACEKLKTRDCLARYDAALAMMGVLDDEIRRSGQALMREAVEEAGRVADFEKSLAVGSRLAESIDPSLQQEGAALINKVWNAAKGDPNTPAVLRGRILDAMRRSGDPELAAIADKEGK